MQWNTILLKMKILIIDLLDGMPLSNLGQKESTEDRRNEPSFFSETFSVGLQPMQGKSTREVGCGMWDPHLIMVYQAKFQVFQQTLLSPCKVFFHLPNSF